MDAEDKEPSTLGKGFPPNTFFYDDSCPLCRSLAAWGIDLGVSFRAWQSSAHAFPDASDDDVLRCWNGSTLLSGPEAWEVLITLDPRMVAFGWIAEKMGWQKQVATVVQKAGALVRRVCGRCGFSLAAKP